MDKAFQAYVAISIFLDCLGMAANLIALFILYKRKDLRTTWNVVNIPLNLSEILFDSGILAGLICANFSQLESQTLTCIIPGMITMTSASFSSFSVVFIALERYRAICFGQPLSTRVWISIVANVVFFSILFAILPLFDPLSYVVTPSKTYCIAPWYSSSWILHLTSIAALIALFLVVIFISFFYFRIFQQFRKMSQKSNRANMTVSSPKIPSPSTQQTLTQNEEEQSSITCTANAPKLSSVEKKDRIILIKSICYVVAFGFLWLPYVMLIMVEMTTQQQASPAWHITASMFSVISTIVNPTIFILLSPAFVAEIKSWFH